MASNTLLAGELARRNKEIEPTSIKAVADHVHATTLDRSIVQGIQTETNNHWTGTAGVQDLVVESVHLGHHPIEDDHKLGGPHFLSNPLSLITSLGSSREGSPERIGGVGSGSGKPSLGSKFVVPPSGPVGAPWFTSPGISMSPLLVFAALGDT